MSARTFTVRLSLEAQGLYLTYTAVPGQDADEAAARAVKKAEAECASTGFVLDGPVEEEASSTDERFFVRSKVRGFVRDCYVTIEPPAAEHKLKHECQTAERLFKRLGIEASFRVSS